MSKFYNVLSLSLLLLGISFLSYAGEENNQVIIESFFIDDYLKTGDQTLELKLINAGDETVNSVELFMKVDGKSLNQVFSYDGFLPNASRVAAFANVSILQEGVHEFKAWISKVNGIEVKDPTILTKTSIASKIVRTRNSLIEVFTSSTCGPCRPGNAHLHNNILPNISNYTVLKYQQNFPGAGDIYATGESVGRRGYYGITSIPRATIDGQWNSSAGAMSTTDFNGFQSKNSVLDISLNYTHYDGKLIVLDAEVTSETDIPTGDYRIHAVVYENKTTQNVGNNRETEFLQVVQKMMYGTGGMKVTSFTAGVPVKIQKGYTSTPLDNIEEMTDLRMAIFVQDNATKRVAQSFNTRIGHVSSVNADEMSAQYIESFYPNPANTTAFVRFQLDAPSHTNIQVVNSLGQVVYSENQKATPGANDVRIDLNTFESGVYRLLVNTEKGMMTKNFTVAR